MSESDEEGGTKAPHSKEAFGFTFRRKSDEVPGVLRLEAPPRGIISPWLTDLSG